MQTLADMMTRAPVVHDPARVARYRDELAALIAAEADLSKLGELCVQRV
jgi:hypothetical protein